MILKVSKKAMLTGAKGYFILLLLGTSFFISAKEHICSTSGYGFCSGYSNTQLGLLGSTLYFTYAIGKFVNGILADRANVRTFLPTALILSALSNICFALSSVFITPGKFTFFGLPCASVLLWVLAFFWGCNGWFSRQDFQALPKALPTGIQITRRGTKWALWSTSHQTGTFL